MAKKEKKVKGLWTEFKAFINRGNAFMLAVGVVIGGAFSAIVNAFVGILMSFATWPLPGGLTGLVFVLPAPSWAPGQKGLDGIGQSFAAADYNTVAKSIGEAAGASDPMLYGSNVINGNYTKYGTNFYFNGSCLINVGALINAVITFLIIAVVLFIIVKVIAVATAKDEAIKAKAQEEYYKKHPEERPVPPEPGKPAPTEVELLTEIRDALKAQAK